MARQPKLRMTNADYVAIAVSPALIMALVGSLVYFLIEVLYVGQYQARLNYVFALFVFATVLIGRISIEMGAERAAMFAFPLAVAMFLVLAKFVQHASPYSHLINIALLGIVWWSTHKLTWDCTLIDDSEDASGEGLMQRIGADELVADSSAESGNVHNELLPTDDKKKTKTPHTPGLWVLYFSLAALPLFGIGQKWIPASDVGRRQYAFGLLAVYVAAGLALLVTTSFLGLRRYLRQRRVEMPGPMAATWVVTGGVLIAVVMLLAALIPRPQAEYAISQVPWQISSPSDLSASRSSVGNDGTEDDREDARKVTNEESDPNASATREGDQPTTTTEQGQQQSSQSESENSSQQPTGEQSAQGKQSESADTKQSNAQTRDQQPSDPSDDAEPAEEQAKQSPDDNSPSTPAESREDSRSSEGTSSDSSSEYFRPPEIVSNLLPMVGGLASVLKLVLYAVLALALGYLGWRNRQQIAKAIAEFVQMVRELLTRLFGGEKPSLASIADEEPKKQQQPPPRPFASFADPFAGGGQRPMPPDELVRYTFEAFEAWARERGCPRSPDQTPGELIRLAVAKNSSLWNEAQRLARLYNEAAYAPGSVSIQEVEKLGTLWSLMRQAAQTPLESIS